ncbi:UDP-N-acetylglucosamine--N-acetylmuramyl-(pentapeptide) pyrophosphoryl-undecaprenol N-acetylglucosamine transferase [Pseudonocardia bannensis]|uniref:UDP-N-acetylglucosamine--N-acetylmuramyl-(Pentapeptide) pyrophosphoryl-undecaprenol N-acetylglucosamine transferase n=2 Tax=Pseudonocardia bannensis TaxID=630973 RepID=A0A848DIB7_9PSEU|nr:UDP-N-acetylglucosamine--N-acetylmuramyl-(pentapeptide) pyrophosphoryl-undecaprenol N-acetylglucosamine transferase [Pseudonocardia bannensis]
MPVVGFSGRGAPPGWTGRWIRLPGDELAAGADPAPFDVTARGVLHWAPRHHDGMRTRMGLISEFLARGDVRLLVTDVSVEVALLARLLGVPVVVMAQPGDRTDRPHRLAYDLAERLLAPWPARPAPDWPQAWRDKTVHLGAISRFDGRAVPVPGPGGPRRVLALWGSGGLDVTADQVHAAAAATPGWCWDVVGPPPPAARDTATVRWRGWLADPWPALSEADVVVTHAGQNALAEVAAARRPAVVVPQERPHGEQRATAAALGRAHIATVAARWPDPDRWPGLLERTLRRGGGSWAAWSTGTGGQRAAALLEELAAG